MDDEPPIDPDMPEQTIRMDSLHVGSNYRFIIPADIRSAHDMIAPGRLVTGVLLIGDEEEHFNKKMDREGRVTIPERIRKEHGIEIGDQVDIEIDV